MTLYGELRQQCHSLAWDLYLSTQPHNDLQKCSEGQKNLEKKEPFFLDLNATTS